LGGDSVVGGDGVVAHHLIILSRAASVFAEIRVVHGGVGGCENGCAPMSGPSLRRRGWGGDFVVWGWWGGCSPPDNPWQSGFGLS
jgi:hypothetical protein